MCDGLAGSQTGTNVRAEIRLGCAKSSSGITQDFIESWNALDWKGHLEVI